MRKLIALLIWLPLFAYTQNKTRLPSFIIGNFSDDYGITYQINDSVWIQNPRIRYNILKIDTANQYIICKNDVLNKADANKYTRIDYMTFENMAPYKWGFCLTAYDALTDKIAEETAAADRKNPKKGCNGYPFSRMKMVESKP